MNITHSRTKNTKRTTPRKIKSVTALSAVKQHFTIKLKTKQSFIMRSNLCRFILLKTKNPSFSIRKTMTRIIDRLCQTTFLWFKEKARKQKTLIAKITLIPWLTIRTRKKYIVRKKNCYKKICYQTPYYIRINKNLFVLRL